MTTTIGRYQIIRPLGAGGMADVYLAQDPTLGRQVAIKVIGSGRFDANLLARFMREARTVANLEHPAIVPLYDYGEQDGRPYLVMRYMAGGSLSERIARRPLSLAEATTVVSRIAAALDFAHAQGIIHRDVKPDNILFDDAGAAYLSDFGIARYAAIGTGKSLTSTGAVIGTTAYMSPEQALGKGDLDGRSDLYSLGAVLFEALSGDVPYKADSALQQAMLHINAPIPDIRARRPDLPPVTQTIISRVLAKEPQARYQSAAALTGDLRRVT
ncbi:MAG: serine/threonine protein kinase, partial [Anaerolineae bacterium]